MSFNCITPLLILCCMISSVFQLHHSTPRPLLHDILCVPIHPVSRPRGPKLLLTSSSISQHRPSLELASFTQCSWIIPTHPRTTTLDIADSQACECISSSSALSGSRIGGWSRTDWWWRAPSLTSLGEIGPRCVVHAGSGDLSVPILISAPRPICS